MIDTRRKSSTLQFNPAIELRVKKKNTTDIPTSYLILVLAYSFFVMYMGVKYLQYQVITASAHVIEYLDIIWNVDDQAIFAGIISFYYGQRTFRKVWKKR